MQHHDNDEIRTKKQCLKEALYRKDPVAPENIDREIEEVINEINHRMTKTRPQRALLRQDAYKLGKVSLRKVDLVALMILPTVFIVFNLGYWIHYGFFSED